MTLWPTLPTLPALTLLAACSLVATASGMKGQSWNSAAVKTLGRVARRPSLAVPHVRVAHAGQVDWAALHAAGIRGVVFDKDNTITAPYVSSIHPDVAAGVEACRKLFGPAVVVMSNSAGGPDDAGYADALAVEAALALPVLRRQKKKPEGFDELHAWFRALDHPGLATVAPHELAMVGDRLLTDVVFGNLHGMLTVHVRPLTLVGDNTVAKVVRSVENRLLLPAITRAPLVGAAPPPHPFASGGGAPFVLAAAAAGAGAAAAAEGTGDAGAGAGSTQAMLRLIDIEKQAPGGKLEADESAAGAKVGNWPIWECAAWPAPAGRFQESRWWEPKPGVVEERCYIISGRAKLTVSEGEGEPVELMIAEGDRVVFRKGFSCTWDVQEPIAKHYEYFDAEGRKWVPPIER